jgi:hypothetical protein
VVHHVLDGVLRVDDDFIALSIRVAFLVVTSAATTAAAAATATATATAAPTTPAVTTTPPPYVAAAVVASGPADGVRDGLVRIADGVTHRVRGVRRGVHRVIHVMLIDAAHEVRGATDDRPRGNPGESGLESAAQGAHDQRSREE